MKQLRNLALRLIEAKTNLSRLKQFAITSPEELEEYNDVIRSYEKDFKTLLFEELYPTTIEDLKKLYLDCYSDSKKSLYLTLIAYTVHHQHIHKGIVS